MFQVVLHLMLRRRLDEAAEHRPERGTVPGVVAFEGPTMEEARARAEELVIERLAVAVIEQDGKPVLVVTPEVVARVRPPRASNGDGKGSLAAVVAPRIVQGKRGPTQYRPELPVPARPPLAALDNPTDINRALRERNYRGVLGVMSNGERIAIMDSKTVKGKLLGRMVAGAKWVPIRWAEPEQPG